MIFVRRDVALSMKMLSSCESGVVGVALFGDLNRPLRYVIVHMCANVRRTALRGVYLTKMKILFCYQSIGRATLVSKQVTKIVRLLG